MTHAATALFERIYQTDLVYQPDCWQLCGDAHCCNFSRYKARFKLLSRPDVHELPLLPGEFEFLESKQWHLQFQTFERKQVHYDFGNGSVCFESVVSRRPGCVCDHATRTVICRLYPLLPVFEIDGTVVGTEALGVYEELEKVEALDRACRISALDFEQLNRFLAICRLLGSDPVLLFHVMAYRAAKRHAASRLAAAKATTAKSAFALFEAAVLRRRLFDHTILKPQLATLYAAFAERYGDAFTGRMSTLDPRSSGTHVANPVASVSGS